MEMKRKFHVHFVFARVKVARVGRSRVALTKKSRWTASVQVPISSFSKSWVHNFLYSISSDVWWWDTWRTCLRVDNCIQGTVKVTQKDALCRQTKEANVIRSVDFTIANQQLAKLVALALHIFRLTVRQLVVIKGLWRVGIRSNLTGQFVIM